ncbi:hypothetical protein [Dyadobacter sp. NIV53]|uniref:hypothetical protein n=1 Tax=Dyadobacter sp. NIV53 TaxID=2861765 RepID=UPI001C872EEF|nr:hypothetical protein [Dyadobacter sp. NIV53]
MLTITKYRILFSIQVALEKPTAVSADKMLLGESFTIRAPIATQVLLTGQRIAHRVMGNRWTVFLEVQPGDDTEIPKRFVKNEPKIKLPDPTLLRFFLEPVNVNILNETNLKTIIPLNGEVFYFSNKSGKKLGSRLFLNQNDVNGIGNTDRKTKAEIGLGNSENPFGVIDIWHDPATVPADFQLFDPAFISNEDLFLSYFSRKRNILKTEYNHELQNPRRVCGRNFHFSAIGSTSRYCDSRIYWLHRKSTAITAW